MVFKLQTSFCPRWEEWQRSLPRLIKGLVPLGDDIERIKRSLLIVRPPGIDSPLSGDKEESMKPRVGKVGVSTTRIRIDKKIGRIEEDTTPL